MAPFGASTIREAAMTKRYLSGPGAVWLVADATRP
jgi:hypothetical protein